MRLVSVDPGRALGWACFDNGKLTACGRPNKTSPRIPSGVPDRVIIEKPQVYKAGEGGENPNDLVVVAMYVGWVARWALRANPKCQLELVLPNRWKGQVPKNIHNARTLELMKQRGELDILGKMAKDDNVIDAIGLGLWALKRQGDTWAPPWETDPFEGLLGPTNWPGQ